MGDEFAETVMILVEGILDGVVLERIATHTGVALGKVYGKQGKDYLNGKISVYNNAARIQRWFVLRDLDSDAPCAAELRRTLLPNPAPYMQLRIAVHEVEAWLLADRERFARFFHVNTSEIDSDPEQIIDPKSFILRLAERSSNRGIKKNMVRNESGKYKEGSAYNGLKSQFVRDNTTGWRPEVASDASDSLRRCILRLKELANTPINYQ